MRNPLHSTEKMQKIKVNQAKVASIFLMAILTLSVATISLEPRATEAQSVSELCSSLGIVCNDPTSSSPPPSEETPPPSEETPPPSEETPPPSEETSSSTLSSSGKFFLALFLQYVNRDAQVNIYKPNMGSEDFTRLRVQNGDQLKSDYVTAAKNLPGPAAVAFMSSQEIVENAERVKDLGFNAIEFNLESGLSPSSDNNNVVSAMKRAADAAHAQGLKFRATPSKSYTTQYGSQIAPLVDYYHIQAQSLQDNGIKAYSDYVHTQVAKLEKANPNLLISVQLSTQQGNAPGLSKLNTFKQCTDSVMDVADGVSVWFGGGDLSVLKSFVEWYNNKWS
jgi:hypothetical protein